MWKNSYLILQTFVAVLIPYKLNFTAKSIIRYKDGNFPMIIVLIHQDEIAVLNLIYINNSLNI